MPAHAKRLTTSGLALSALALMASPGAWSAAPQVIELTQTPCQFLESENGVDQGFKSTQKADCEAINAKTGAERLAKAKVLELAPGSYVFRVTNKDVPYELGFWLREADYDGRNPLGQADQDQRLGRRPARGRDQGLRGRAQARRLRLFLSAQPDPELPDRGQGLRPCRARGMAMAGPITTDLCVIGAGSGGLAVAAGAVQMGARVVLIEKGKMGGDCLNYGCVPSKALIAAGKAAQTIRTRRPLRGQRP